MGLRIAFRMFIASLARHYLLKLLERVGSNVGVPILGNDNGRGSMGHEHITETITCAAFGHRPIHFGSDINNGKTLRGFNFEFDHRLKLTLMRGTIPSPPLRAAAAMFSTLADGFETAEFHHPFRDSVVKGRILTMRVDENVGVNGDHAP